MTKPYNVISFRVSTAEKRILNEKAARLGLCVSAYLRAHAYLPDNPDPVHNALPTTHQLPLEDTTNAPEPPQTTTTPGPNDPTLPVP